MFDRVRAVYLKVARRRNVSPLTEVGWGAGCFLVGLVFWIYDMRTLPEEMPFPLQYADLLWLVLLVVGFLLLRHGMLRFKAARIA
jgi:hypothetical protein